MFNTHLSFLHSLLIQVAANETNLYKFNVKVGLEALNVTCHLAPQFLTVKIEQQHHKYEI